MPGSISLPGTDDPDGLDGRGALHQRSMAEMILQPLDGGKIERIAFFQQEIGATHKVSRL